MNFFCEHFFWEMDDDEINWMKLDQQIIYLIFKFVNKSNRLTR